MSMSDPTQINANDQFNDFPAISTHGGQFNQYNIFRNVFEVTKKYRPPIIPIGRGAYGVVWYVILINF